MSKELKKIENIQTKSKLSVGERINYLNKLKKEIIENEDNIYSALHGDLNKPKFEVYTSEIGFLLNEIELFIKHLNEWSKPKKVKSSIINFPSDDYVYSEPYGKVLIISPWNYPFQLAILPVLSAFSCGNTVVLKPSEHTPETSKLVNKIISKIFPSNLVFVVEGDYKVASKLLKLKWDYIFFTGSVRVGKIVAAEAAKQLTPHTLELGGKSPCVIDKKINLKTACKRIVWGKFMNAGQTCVAPDYLLVHKSIKSDLVKELSLRIELTYGKNLSANTNTTKIVNEENFNRLINLINSNKILFGGEYNSDEKKIYPTIIDQPNINGEIMQSEIFGPILPIFSFENISEIDKIILSNPDPLALYVFSNDNEFSENIIRRFRFGGGVVNDTIIHLTNPNLPFGGIGNSGYGSYHGKSSFDLFTHKKSIIKRKMWLENNLRYAPYKNKLNLVKKILKYLS
jgi:aldehyde dehydrogenase (NAD+)